MNEEMNTELMEINDTEVEVYDEPERSGGIGKIVVGVGLMAVAGVGAYLYKTKEKRKAKRISKLVEEGYIVYKPEEGFEDEFEEDFDENYNESEETEK